MNSTHLKDEGDFDQGLVLYQELAIFKKLRKWFVNDFKTNSEMHFSNVNSDKYAQDSSNANAELTCVRVCKRKQQKRQKNIWEIEVDRNGKRGSTTLAPELGMRRSRAPIAARNFENLLRQRNVTAKANVNVAQTTIDCGEIDMFTME